MRHSTERLERDPKQIGDSGIRPFRNSEKSEFISSIDSEGWALSLAQRCDDPHNSGYPILYVTFKRPLTLTCGRKVVPLARSSSYFPRIPRDDIVIDVFYAITRQQTSCGRVLARAIAIIGHLRTRILPA